MNITHSLAQLQQEHVVLELECLDRMYLNADVPKLTSEGGIAAFCRGYWGHRFASTQQAVAMTQAFVQALATFLQREGLELVRFQKGQRKDAVLQQKLRRFKKPEGVIFVGVAQEKVRGPRTTRKAGLGGGTNPWIIDSTAMKSTPSSAKGSPACPTPTAPRTAKPATATIYPSAKPSSPSPKSGTAQSTGVASSRKSSAKTSMGAVRNRCR